MFSEPREVLRIDEYMRKFEFFRVADRFAEEYRWFLGEIYA